MPTFSRSAAGRGLAVAAVLLAAAQTSVAKEAVDGWALTRGDWERIDDGVARCVFDIAEYEKYAKHGPIAMKNFEATDATLSATFTVTESDVEAKSPPRVVLTFDAEKGHAARLWLFPEPPGKKGAKKGAQSRAAVWVEGEKTPQPVMKNGSLPPLLIGEEMTVSMSTKGETLVVEINGERFEAEHPAAARGKRRAKLSFAFGDVTIRELDAGPNE